LTFFGFYLTLDLIEEFVDIIDLYEPACLAIVIALFYLSPKPIELLIALFDQAEPLANNLARVVVATRFDLLANQLF
jgi:hypothetical protein